MLTEEEIEGAKGIISTITRGDIDSLDVGVRRCGVPFYLLAPFSDLLK